MRSLISLLCLGVFVFLVAGWFLDWYDVSKVKSDNGKSSYQVDINGNKIKEDLNKGKQKLGDTIENFDEKNKAGKTSTPNQSAAAVGWSPVPH